MAAFREDPKDITQSFEMQMWLNPPVVGYNESDLMDGKQRRRLMRKNRRKQNKVKRNKL